MMICELGLVGYDDCLTRSRSRVRFSELVLNKKIYIYIIIIIIVVVNLYASVYEIIIRISHTHYIYCHSVIPWLKHQIPSEL